MATIEVFHDFECPFCMRGVRELMGLLGDFPEVTIEWHPIEGHPRPEVHAPHTDLAIQGYFFAVDHGVKPEVYNARLYHAVHKDGIDVEDPAALADYVKDLVDPEAYEKALREGTYREIQEAQNDLAYEEREVWFIPAFRSGEHRLDAQGGVGVTKDQILKLLEAVSQED